MKLPRLTFVTGKGGVGKTTVTHLLGRQSQAQGFRTAVIEINGEKTLSQSFGSASREFGPVVIDKNLDLFSLDALECLHDFGRQKLRSKWLVKMLLGHRVVETLIDGVPGFHDLFQLGKINHLATDNGEFPPYERVIVDTPATGHAATLFSAACSIRDMTRVGLVYDEAKQMAEVLSNPQMTSTVVVTFPEALPIQETIEFIRNQQPEHPNIGGVIINRCIEGDVVEENDWATIQKCLANNPELQRVSKLWRGTLVAQKEHIELLKSVLPEGLPLGTVSESSDGFLDMTYREVLS